MMPRLRSSKTNCAVPNRRMGIEARLRNTIALACFSCKRLVLRFGCYLRVYVCSAAGTSYASHGTVDAHAHRMWSVLPVSGGCVDGWDSYPHSSTYLRTCTGPGPPTAAAGPCRPLSPHRTWRAHGTAVVLDRNTAPPATAVRIQRCTPPHAT